MGTDATEAGPDCRPLTWKEVAEESHANAIARRNEGKQLLRELQAAHRADLAGIVDELNEQATNRENLGATIRSNIAYENQALGLREAASLIQSLSTKDTA
jgi:uncharacterized pyridoxal phosphate-containing UPF0001 family protein